MSSIVFKCLVVLVLIINNVCGQVLQFGTCANVTTVQYFEIEKFLGVWYEIKRTPTWYESNGQCALKIITRCGRRVRIKHVYVKEDIKYVLHVNSTYEPGDEAIFEIAENSVDPVGIPLLVISTNYKDYAVVYGCSYNEDLNIKYISAWILSRDRTLAEELVKEAQDLVNSLIGGSSTTFFEDVEQVEEKCPYRWTAQIQADNTTTSEPDIALLNRT